MSRPGASWWPDEVVEELPGNPPKRCKMESSRQPADTSSPDFLANAMKKIKDDTDDKSRNPKTSNDSPLMGKDGTSTQSTDDNIWIVRRVVQESSEDEDDTNDDDRKLDTEHDSIGSHQHSHSLPGNIEDDFKSMCLHEATEKRLFNVIFKKKEDIDHVNNWGETSLHFAAEIGATGIAALLIDRGANPNAIDDYGLTPLILASSFGHAEVAEILLEAGADVHYQDDIMMAPLHFAAHSGFENVVRVLLDHGADPAQEDRDGHMPCDFAFHGGHLQLAEFLFKILDENRKAEHEEDPEKANSS